MLPRLHAGPSHRVSASLLRQARVSATASTSKGGSRQPAVVASCRLVLRPTGSGSYEHIGDKVSLPSPIVLGDGIYEVGRCPPADITINVPTVSSRHALLRVEGNKLEITDLNSTNGTLVNGQELSPMDNAQLEVGAEVIFGDMFLAKFQLEELPDAAAAAAGAEQPVPSQQQAGTSPVHPNNATFDS